MLVPLAAPVASRPLEAGHQRLNRLSWTFKNNQLAKKIGREDLKPEIKVLDGKSIFGRHLIVQNNNLQQRFSF